MDQRVDGLAAQVRAALDGLESQPWERLPRAPSVVVVGGVGGSAIAADLTRAALSDRLEQLVETVRDYQWPAWLREDALLVLSSYSGDTEETLALAEASRRLRAGRVALTSGGKLAEWCAHEGVPVLRMPGGYVPRAAVPSAWVLLTELCARARAAVSFAGEWQSAAEALEAGAARLGTRVPERRNPAKRLARALAGRLVLVYAAGEDLLPLAVRWKQQLNENAKMACCAGALPEIDHNEIEGWPPRRSAARRVAAVFLRDALEPARLAPRLAVTRELFEESGVETWEVRAAGQGRLARMASLLQWGDYVSLYLAYLGRVDPTPVRRLDFVKRRLAQRGG
jgi:glucose/mannose-6-phosphate isomerase